MSYIGVPPQTTFSSGLLDRFTSTTGTTVTLTHDIASENDIVVFVNFVKQDSTTYSVGGTGNKTLTLGGTLVSSDIVEVHYLNIVGQTNAPSAGSVTTATINDLAVTGAKLNTDVISAQTELATAPASTDELLVSDAGVLKRVDVSLVGGANTPNFLVRRASTQIISDASGTKIQFDSEVYDSASAFDSSSNYRFTVPSGQAGKYYFYGTLCISSDGNSTNVNSQVYVYKNGSIIAQYENNNSDNNPRTQVIPYTYSESLSVGDYIEVYGYCDTSNNASPKVQGDSTRHKSTFGGFKIIE